MCSTCFCCLFIISLFHLLLGHYEGGGGYRGVLGRGGNCHLQVCTLLQGPEVECAKNVFFSHTAVVCLFPIVPWSAMVRKGWGRVVSCGECHSQCPYLLYGGHSDVCTYFTHLASWGKGGELVPILLWCSDGHTSCKWTFHGNEGTARWGQGCLVKWWKVGLPRGPG
jgi:hypothetical protein